MGHSTGSGRSQGSNGRNTATEATNRAVERAANQEAERHNTPANIEAAQRAISNLKSSGSRFQRAQFMNPRDGHQIDIAVERVQRRDYWGRRTGAPPSYRIVIDDNGDRAWYTYRDSFRDIKEDIYRVTGVPKGNRRR